MTPGPYITAKVGANLNGKENYIAKLDTNGAAILATAGTDEIVGVLSECPQDTGTNGSCSIAHVSGDGTGKVIVASATARNAYLTATTGGKAIGTTTPGNRVFGRLRYATLNANEIGEYEKMYFIYPS